MEGTVGARDWTPELGERAWTQQFGGLGGHHGSEDRVMGLCVPERAPRLKVAGSVRDSVHRFSCGVFGLGVWHDLSLLTLQRPPR